jgi:hypothetical protein
MAGREQPTGRIAGIGASGAVPGPTTPRWSAERRGPGFARDAPRLASVASRPTSATTGSTPPGAPPAPSFRGRVTKRTQRGCKRKARTRPQDCGTGTKKRTLFDIVNGNDASGSLVAANLRITSAATRSGHGRGRAFLRHQVKVPARMRRRRDTAVTTDRRRRRCRASSTRARGQPTAVHVPSGLRQALPRATCGLPSI